MFGLGVGEIAVILFIALIFIGPKKLPELAKGLGKGMREFQNAMRGVQSQLKDPMDEIRNQIQSQANAQPRGSFQDDPSHDQNIPKDEIASEPEYEEDDESEFVHPDHANDFDDDEALTEAEEQEAQQLEEQIAKDLGKKPS